MGALLTEKNLSINPKNQSEVSFFMHHPGRICGAMTSPEVASPEMTSPEITSPEVALPVMPSPEVMNRK